LAWNAKTLASTQQQLGYRRLAFRLLFQPSLHKRESYGLRFPPQPLPPGVKTVLAYALFLAITTYR
jgi:hypothetical protein